MRAGDLRAALVREHGFVRDLRVVAETGSTNDDLAELAQTGAPEGTVVTADYQSAGQGRLARGWTSPPRAGLAVSVLLRPTAVPAHRWSWLPLLTGCAVTAAIAEVTSLTARLKWPNDVLLVEREGDEPRERKVGGILMRRIDTPDGPAAVVGIGLNVSLRPAELPVPTATSLAIAGAPADRDTLLRSTVRSLGALYERWRDAAGDPDVGLADAYRRRCATLGQRVRVEVGPGRWVEGDAVGIDADGRLVVDSADGEMAWGAGDVVHVR